MSDKAGTCRGTVYILFVAVLTCSFCAVLTQFMPVMIAVVAVLVKAVSTGLLSLSSCHLYPSGSQRTDFDS